MATHSLDPTLSSQPMEATGDARAPWNSVDVLALPSRPEDRYVAGFANSDRCVEAVQRLRYLIFNVELGEGLAEAALTGLDRDLYDKQMTHLVLLERASGSVVGTYRMQTVGQALTTGGIYSAELYDLSPLTDLFGESVELSRACLAVGHRNSAAIFALWLGIGAFMNLHRQRYLFGCCSITSQDPDDGWRAMKTIRAEGYLHPRYFIRAVKGQGCGEPQREFAENLGPALQLPKLFRTYMRLGVKVVSEPALDTRFGTVDFLVLLDGHEVTLQRLDVLK